MIGWKITPVFNISQHEREILAWIKYISKFGTIRFRKIWMFEVSNQKSLWGKILPFLNNFDFLSKKKKLQYQTPSNTYETVRQIFRNESNIKTSKKRKYIDAFIL